MEYNMQYESTCIGIATITTKSNKNSAITWFRVNFPGHVGHVTIFS